MQGRTRAAAGAASRKGCKPSQGHASRRARLALSRCHAAPCACKRWTPRTQLPWTRCGREFTRAIAATTGSPGESLTDSLIASVLALRKLRLEPDKLGQEPPNVSPIIYLLDHDKTLRVQFSEGDIVSQVDAAAAVFERWFTWCQCCHHGGHAACLRSWFELHTVCPVSGCKCICMAKDV